MEMVWLALSISSTTKWKSMLNFATPFFFVKVCSMVYRLSSIMHMLGHWWIKLNIQLGWIEKRNPPIFFDGMLDALAENSGLPNILWFGYTTKRHKQKATYFCQNKHHNKYHDRPINSWIVYCMSTNGRQQTCNTSLIYNY
jgi:hypothetical protein